MKKYQNYSNIMLVVAVIFMVAAVFTNSLTWTVIFTFTALVEMLISGIFASLSYNK